MKITCLLAAVLILVLIAGCGAKTEEEPERTEPAEPVEAEETPEEPEAAPEEEPGLQGADAIFTRDGFTPAEVKLTAGGTLKILVNDEYGTGIFTFRIIGGEADTRVENGEVGLLKFEEAGEYEVRSIPLQKKLVVTIE